MAKDVTLHIPDVLAQRLTAAGGDLSRRALEALSSASHIAITRPIPRSRPHPVTTQLDPEFSFDDSFGRSCGTDSAP